MNSSDIYDRSLFKTKFKEIHNKNKYNLLIAFQRLQFGVIQQIIKIG